MTLHLGVDGGKTKTLAVVCDDTGTVQGLGRAGNCDLYDADSDDQAVRELTRAVDQALTSAAAGYGSLPGSTTLQVDSAAFRLAGVDWPEDNAYWTRVIEDRYPQLAKVSIANDGLAALRAGDLSGQGVAIVLGTGSALAARGPAGEWSSGFWLQDGLGAIDLGERALRAVCLADLGLGEPTALTGRLLDHHGQPDVGALLHFFSRRRDGGTWQDHADSAREVTRAASDGDQVANEIIRTFADGLAEYAQVAARKVGWPDGTEIPVILAGSVLTSESSPVLDAVESALASTLPEARRRGFLPYGKIKRASRPPVIGAVLDAMAEAGISPNSERAEALMDGGGIA